MLTTAKKKYKTSTEKVIFDDSQFDHIKSKPLSVEKTEELEKTLGEPLLKRLKEEFEKLGYKFPEK